MFVVGAWYLATGLTNLAFAGEDHALSPWAMAAPYGIGQLLMAGILYRSTGAADAEG
jgi:hypothetical protein